MKRIKIVFLGFLVLSGLQLSGQRLGIGEWSSHAQFSNIESLFLVEDRLFGANEFHSFYVDRISSEVNILSKVNALSDVGVTTVTKKSGEDLIMVGYESGNIDLFLEGDVINIPLISNTTIEGDKAIMDGIFSNGFLYAMTKIGVFVVDYEKEELTESFRELGPDAQQVEITASGFHHDSLFLKTDFGIIAAPLTTTINLQDFNNWKEISTPADFIFLRSTSDRLFGSDHDDIYEYIDGNWENLDIDNPQINKLSVSGNQLVAVHSAGYTVIGNETITNALDGFEINDVVLEADNIWLADSNRGLVKITGTAETTPLSNFITSTSITSVKVANGQTYVFNDGGTPISIFEEAQWRSKELSSTASDIAYSTVSNLTYISLFSEGVMVLEDSSMLDGPFSTPIRISALAVDRNDHLWVAQLDHDIPLLSRSPEGEWTTHSFSENGARFIEELQVDDFGVVWAELSSQAGGVLAYDPQNDQSKWLRAANSNLPSGTTNDIAIDEDGQVWFATNSGVFFLPFSLDVFETAVELFQPVFGTRFLFEEERVGAVVVDGGNRKWMSTAEGAWLLEEDADELVANFNLDNSPMPSNDISGIAINDLNGEVFITTGKGLVSYRSDASQGGRTHANSIQVFPNPVTPGFAGQIGIYGTASEAVLKITDAAGNLVRELESQGGSTSWDLLDYNGRRAVSGVYLIFSSTRDGTDTLVGKFAVVN